MYNTAAHSKLAKCSQTDQLVLIISARCYSILWQLI